MKLKTFNTVSKLEELIRFKQQIRKFVAEEINPYIDEWELKREYPARKIIKKLGKLDVFRKCYLNENHDSQEKYLFNKTLHQELAYCKSVVIGSCVNNHLDAATTLIATYANDVLKNEWLEDCLTGNKIITLASTEPQTGSDIGAIQTTAKQNSDKYILNGEKWFISNAVIADGFCILSKTANNGNMFDYSLFLVTRNLKGVEVNALDTMGLRGKTIGSIKFNDVVVDKHCLVGSLGMGIPLTIKQFEKERLSLAIRAASISRHHIEQLKKDINNNKYISTIKNSKIVLKICELTNDLEKLMALTDYTISQRFAKKEFTGLSAMSKISASKLAKDTADTLMEYYEYEGCHDNHFAARFFRDVKAMSMSGGSDEMMLTTIYRKCCI